MSKQVSIKDVIVNNYDEIKDRTYNWDDDEVGALYRLVKSRLFLYDVHPSEREDLLQSIMLHIFNVIVTKIDVNKKDAITTYLVACIDNKIKNHISISDKQIAMSSLDVEITDENGNARKIMSIELIKDECDTDNNKEVSEYLNELKYLMFHFEIARLSCVEGMTQQEIADIYNISRSNVSLRISLQLDAMKLILMTKGYTSEFFYNNFGYDVFSDEYKYCESNIEKYGLYYSVYNNGNNIKDIAESLNMDTRSIVLALDYLKKDKLETLKNLNYKYPSAYVEMIEYFCPHIAYNLENQSKQFFEYLDSFIESEKLLYLKFVEGKKLIEISKMFNKQQSAVSNRLHFLGKKIEKNMVVKNGIVNIIKRKRI